MNFPIKILLEKCGGRTIRIQALVIALVILPAISFANIVVNGGFETGDFFGWTLSGNTDGMFVDNTLPLTGNFAADLGPVDTDGILSQLLPTIPGQAYNLVYWLQNEGGTPNFFSASWDSSVIAGSVITDNDPGFEYTLFGFSGLVATSSSTLLAFDVEHTPAFWHLDEISVEAAPEPSPGPLVLMVGLGMVVFQALRRRRPAA